MSVLRDLYGHVRRLAEGPKRTIPHRFIADGDHVAVEARGGMVTKAGLRYDNEYCLIFRLENGKIVEVTKYLDSALCLSVIGEFPAPRTEV